MPQLTGNTTSNGSIKVELLDRNGAVVTTSYDQANVEGDYSIGLEANDDTGIAGSTYRVTLPTGTVLTGIAPDVFGSITALEEAGSAGGATYASYVPAIRASGTDPTVGDGTLVGRYGQSGGTVHFSINFTYGSTSTGGDGTWGFTLPVAPRADMEQQAICLILDAGTDNKVGVATINGTTGDISSVVVDGANVVTGLTPMTWAAGDELNITGSYEAA